MLEVGLPLLINRMPELYKNITKPSNLLNLEELDTWFHNITEMVLTNLLIISYLTKPYQQDKNQLLLDQILIIILSELYIFISFKLN